jgi:hypothetical protein
MIQRGEDLRFNRVSVARQTSPMPPAPSGPMIS